MRNLIPFALALGVSLIACGDPVLEPPSAADPTTAAQLVEVSPQSLFEAQDRLNDAIAEDGPVAGLSRFLRLDASYNHPGQPVMSGRPIIRDFLASFYAGTASSELTFHSLAGGVSIDAYLGFTFGWLEEERDGTIGYGRYILAWKRTAFVWRIHAFNRAEATRPADPPPADARILDLDPGLPQWGLPITSATEIAAADYAFAELSIDKGYSVAFATYADDAAVALGTNNLYWNREAVAEAFGGWTPAETLRWAPIRAESTASGDLGWSVGHSTFVLQQPGSEPLQFPGKYLTVWRRTESGDWRFLVDGGSPGR